MQILRAFLALLAGFASMAAIVAVTTAILMKLVPKWVGERGHPRAGHVVTNLGYSLEQQSQADMSLPGSPETTHSSMLWPSR
jgi:hypothetical protein